MTEPLVSGWQGASEESGEIPRLVVILPRGEALRTFLYPGCFRPFEQEGRLALLSALPPEWVRPHAPSPPSWLAVLPQENLPYSLRLVHELLDLAHGRRLWSKAAQVRWQLRDHEVGTLGRSWFKRQIKKAAALALANKVGFYTLEKLECLIGKWAARKSMVWQLLQSAKPALVFNTSHVHSRNAILAMHAAKSLGIRTATFVFSWDNLTSQGRLYPRCDYHLVWNRAISKELLQIYPDISPERVFVTGTAQFDAHFAEEGRWSKKRLCQELGLEPDRPIVLYTTGMANHMPFEEELVELVADILANQPLCPQLVVRVYAKDVSGRFDSLRRRRGDIRFSDPAWRREYFTPLPEDGPLLQALLTQCDLGINVASTVSLELMMFGKPVVNIGFNPPGRDISPHDYGVFYQFEHYKPLVEDDAVWLAKSPEELREQIGQALLQPGRKDLGAKKVLSRLFDSPMPGPAALNIAKTLLNLCSAK